MDDSLSHLFKLQSAITGDLLGITIEDNPMQFYYAINGITEEAYEALKEDTRYKETVFNLPGYKSIVNRDKKIEELADVLIYWMNACLYSQIGPNEIIEAIVAKTQEKLIRFRHQGIESKEYDNNTGTSPIEFTTIVSGTTTTGEHIKNK